MCSFGVAYSIYGRTVRSIEVVTFRTGTLETVVIAIIGTACHVAGVRWRVAVVIVERFAAFGYGLRTG